MPMTDILGYVHGTGTSAGPITNTAGVYGDALGAAGSQYTNNEIDFGAPSSGSTFPNVPQFPSAAEKGYVFPPEVVGDGGVEMGMHLIVCSAFNTLTSITLSAVTSATTNALIGGTGNPIASRTLTLAQLAIAGAHYFIPVNFASVLEFLRGYALVTGSNPTTGTCIIWFGPKTGGEQ